MSDLPSKPVNNFALLHTHTPVRKVVGVDVQVLGEIDGASDMLFCEDKGEVANLVFHLMKDAGENQNVVIHGTELKSVPVGGGNYVVVYAEQRKVHVPSMTVIGEPHVWDPCPSCKKLGLYPSLVVKKGDLTVSLEKCRDCNPFLIGHLPHIRDGRGKDPKTLPESVSNVISNKNYVVFYSRAWTTEENHKFYKLKWSDLEKGLFTGMGVPVELPKEVLTVNDDLQHFFLNRHDQLCALWKSCLILDDKFFKIEAISKEFIKVDWESMLELKTTKNRYVLRGCSGENPNSVVAITLIDGLAKVLSSLAIKEKNAYMRLLGRSNLIISHLDSLSLVTVVRDRLTLIAKEVPVFGGDSCRLSFIFGSNTGKRLLMKYGSNDKLVSVRLR